MITVIRHSEDDSDSTFKHDGHLTKNGRELAKIKGRALIVKYGNPTMIYCSPFRRTKETLEEMLAGKEFPVTYTNGVSRYFSSKERKRPEISEDTRKFQVPTNEPYSSFQRRVRKFVTKIYQSLSTGDQVWIITHSTVYKYLANLFSITIDQYIQPTGSFNIDRRDNYKWCSSCKQFHSRKRAA